MASNSKTIITPSGYNCTLSISASVSGANVSGTATITANNTSWAGYGSCVLELYIDGSKVNNVSVPSLTNRTDGQIIIGGVVEETGIPHSASTSNSKSCSNGNVTVKAKWVNPTSASYIPTSDEVSTSVTVNTGSKATLNLSKTSALLNENITLSIENHGVSPTSLTWTCNGTSDSLSPTSQTIDINNLFGEITKNLGKNIQVTFTLTTNGYGSDTKILNLTVPDVWRPQLTFSQIEYINPINNYLISGTSSFRFSVDIDLGQDNPATLARLEIDHYTFTNEVTSDLTFTCTNGTFTSSILPTTSAPSNNLVLFVKATDSRGIYSVYSLSAKSIGTIYSYVPPLIRIIDCYRCTANGTQQATGKYVYFKAQITCASGDSLSSKKITVNNTDYSLNADGNYFSVIGGNNTLEPSQQYNVTLSVLTSNMASYQENPITNTVLLPRAQMPLSLYDDGNLVGISVGEMASNFNVSTNKFVNFSKDTILRGVNSSNGVFTQYAVNVIYAYQVATTLRNTNLDNNKKIKTLSLSAYTTLHENGQEDLNNTIYFVYEES